MAADRPLPEALADGERRLDGFVGGEFGAYDLNERHEGRRVEEVHPDDPLGPRDRSGYLRHRERRRVRGEDGIGPHDRLELAEEGDLRVEVLDDRLDDEIAARQIVEPSREREPAKRCIAVGVLDLALVDLALQEVCDSTARALPQVVGHLAADGLVARLDRDLCDPGAHGAEPDDPDDLDLRRSHDARDPSGASPPARRSG